MTEILAAKKQRAVRVLERHDRWVVALSGGVDSALLLELAVEARGAERVVAATGVSASLAAADREDARRVARRVGVRHVELATGEMRVPAYRANRGDRCYHCRTELFRVLSQFARGLDAAIAYGAIADDSRSDRPGMRAADEASVVAPLVEAGITKDDVRGLARSMGLEVAEKPAAACLASRVPVGQAVTLEALERIERAEAGVRRSGFRVARVRDHGQLARVELDDVGLARLAEPEERRRMVQILRDVGYRFVTIDLEGYRPAGTAAAPPSADETEPG
jgi:uncharacterized protein